MSSNKHSFKILMDQYEVSAYRISVDTGIPETTLSRWARNESSLENITAINLYKISKYFHLTMEEFLEKVNVI